MNLQINSPKDLRRELSNGRLTRGALINLIDHPAIFLRTAHCNSIIVVEQIDINKEMGVHKSCYQFEGDKISYICSFLEDSSSSLEAYRRKNLR